MELNIVDIGLHYPTGTRSANVPTPLATTRGTRATQWLPNLQSKILELEDWKYDFFCDLAAFAGVSLWLDSDSAIAKSIKRCVTNHANAPYENCLSLLRILL